MYQDDFSVRNQTFTNGTLFLNALSSVSTSNWVNCTQPVLTAIAMTIPYVIPGSPIYIFADSVPSDANMLTTIRHLNAQKNLQVRAVARGGGQGPRLANNVAGGSAPRDPLGLRPRPRSRSPPRIPLAEQSLGQSPSYVLAAKPPRGLGRRPNSLRT